MSRLSPCSTEGPSRYLLWTRWHGKFIWSGTRNGSVIMEISKSQNPSYPGRDYQMISRLPGHSMVALRASSLDKAKEKADNLFAEWCASMALTIAE